VGIISTPAGINGYLDKCEEYDKAHQVIAFLATIEHDDDLHMVTDDEEEIADQDIQHTESIQHEKVTNEGRTSPIQIGFDDAQHDVMDEHPTFMDDVQEYMHWHCRLNYASHEVMIKLANKKMISQRITWIQKKMEEVEGKTTHM
jgi:hypothetical protein